jgi:hypothetical protein
MPEDLKKGCPLLILAHCILVRVYGSLMNSSMPFNVSINPNAQTIIYLFAFCLSWLPKNKKTHP